MQAIEATGKTLSSDGSDEERHSPQSNTHWETAEASSTKLIPESRVFSGESSTGLIYPRTELSEKPDKKLMLRARGDNVLDSNEMQQSLSSKSQTIHQGSSLSSVASLGVATAVILFIVFIGFLKALDIGVDLKDL